MPLLIPNRRSAVSSLLHVHVPVEGIPAVQSRIFCLKCGTGENILSALQFENHSLRIRRIIRIRVGPQQRNPALRPRCHAIQILVRRRNVVLKVLGIHCGTHSLLLHIAETGNRQGPHSRLVQRRDQKTRQDRQNRHDDKEFYQSKSRSSHFLIPFHIHPYLHRILYTRNVFQE